MNIYGGTFHGVKCIDIRRFAYNFFVTNSAIFHFYVGMTVMDFPVANVEHNILSTQSTYDCTIVKS